MSDLIRRDDVVNLLAEHFTGLKDDLIIPLSFFPSPIDYFRGLINQIPTAEPKVGKWVKDDSSPIAYRCTACGVLQHWSVIQDGRYHYCPNCGAKMERSE